MLVSSIQCMKTCLWCHVTWSNQAGALRRPVNWSWCYGLHGCLAALWRPFVGIALTTIISKSCNVLTMLQGTAGPSLSHS